MGGGCLASRLAHYAPLSERERRSLGRLEERERRFRKGALIHRENDPVRELYIVRSGWLVSFVYLGNGARQIMRFHFPGDIVGVSSLAFGEATDCLAAVTDVDLCPLDQDKLALLFEEEPRLAALIFTLTLSERVSLADRLASIGRTAARARIASLLCEFMARLRVMEGADKLEFTIPLTQEDFGDATGLTAVHVNRMIRGLVEDRLIERHGSRVRILDERRLAAEGLFTDRYANIDTSWLPAAR